MSTSVRNDSYASSTISALAGYSSLLESALIRNDSDFYERFSILRDEVWGTMLLCVGKKNKPYEADGFFNTILPELYGEMELTFAGYIEFFKLLDTLSSNLNIAAISDQFPKMLFCRNNLQKEVFPLLYKTNKEAANEFSKSWYPVTPSCMQEGLRYSALLQEEE